MHTHILGFETLHCLHQHIQTIAPLQTQGRLFVVGGAIRDILLQIEHDPKDIDLTCASDPELLRTHAQTLASDTVSIFRTEKFGTTTLVDKSSMTEYEITPFRTEGIYTDVRHPQDITRSDSLLADSKRRDFTINALYASSLPYSPPTTKGSKQLKNNHQLLRALETHGHLYLSNSHLYISQSHTHIDSYSRGGQEELISIIESAPQYSYGETHCPSASPTIILIDPHRGLHDLLHRTIRTVGNPDNRFQEDALRILRGLRFPNILNQHITHHSLQTNGFTYEKKTWSSMLKYAHLIKHLSSERIHQELIKIFTADNPFGYIALLDELGVISTLFPALAACKDNIQPTLYHPFDTYTHTLLALHALQQRPHTSPMSKCAMLYHDVGKPEQYAYISEQKELNPDNIDMSNYVHHTQTGPAIARKDFRNLGFSNKECEEIARYIRRHHRPGEILESSQKNQLKKWRLLLSDGGIDRALCLIDIAIADRLGQANPLQPPAIAALEDAKNILQSLQEEEGRFTHTDLAIDGHILMDQLDLQPGPVLGELLDKAFDRVIGDIEQRNTPEKILEHLQSL